MLVFYILLILALIFAAGLFASWFVGHLEKVLEVLRG